jgi:hypothetical protein
MKRHAVRRWGLIAALAGMLLRALVAPGYMPMITPGHVSIGFCPGGELVADRGSTVTASPSVAMSMDSMPGMDMGHGHGGVHYDECDFSVALTGAPPPVLPALPALPVLTPLPVPAFLGGVARLAALALPPARGPPTFS